jgi:hypothetical protein
MESRHAATALNILDIKNAFTSLDPRSPDYEPTILHLRLLKKLLYQAAAQYREKYELSSQIPEDIQQGINFLNALRRVHIALGEHGEAEELRKTVEAWTGKMAQDAKTRKLSFLGKNR